MKIYTDYSIDHPDNYHFCLVWCVYDATSELNIGYLDDDDNWRSEETNEILPVISWSPISVEDIEAFYL